MKNMFRYEGLVIIGCGGHARSVADVALSCGIKCLSFIDKNAKVGETIFGFEVKKKIINNSLPGWKYFAAYGDNHIRKLEIQGLSTKGYHLAKIISKSATIGINSNIEDGCFIGHHAHLGPKANISIGCIINTSAVVEHDCYVGSYSHISVNTTLCGKVIIGENCFIGAGATVIDGVSICANVVIGAGAIVINNIENPGTYVGVPARLVSV